MSDNRINEIFASLYKVKAKPGTPPPEVTIVIRGRREARRFKQAAVRAFKKHGGSKP